VRVIHVIGQLVPGGSEKMTLQIADAFARRGSHHAIVALSVVDESFVSSLGADQVPVYNFATKRGRPLTAGLILRAVRRVAKQIDAEIVQGHAWRSSVAAGFVGKSLRLPAIATLHRVYYPRIETTADRFLQHLWRAVIVDSYAVRDLLSTEAAIRHDRIHVIPNFVSPDMFVVQDHDAALDARGKPLRLLMAAHFTPVKGHRFLMAALGRLEKEAPGHFELDLLGTGPLFEETRAQARELGLTDVVRFHGSRSDLREWLQRTDIVVLPSLWEGFGLILAEAAACAKPAVSFATGGAAEVIVDGETGFLVPPGDVAALAEALARLHDDPALRRHLGRSARSRAARLYAIDPVLDAYERLYAEVRNTR
jgi:glycosyltransferase involved in cell wall biosynthesis